MPEEHDGEAEVTSGENREHQQGEAGDNSGQDQREEDEPAKNGFAGKGGAMKGESGEKAQCEREDDCARGDQQAVEDRVPDGAVAEEKTVPHQGELFWRKAAHAAAIERVKNQNDDRQIE